MNLRRLFVLLFAFILLSTTPVPAQLTEIGDGTAGPFKGQHLTVELTSLAPSVSPGGKVMVGLVVTLEEHWHVYWVNAGDSGEPPTVKWTIPPGISAGPMQFPTPTRLPLGPLMDFGYEDTVGFPFQISVAPKVKPGKEHLDAKVTWLVCREVCIPGKAHLGIDLNVAPNAPVGPEVGALGAAIKSLPQPLPADQKFSVLGGKDELVVTVLNAPDVNPDDVEFYPFNQDQIVNAEDPGFELVKNGFRLRLTRAPDPNAQGTSEHPADPGPLPTRLHGLLKLSDGESYDVSGDVVPGEVAKPIAPAKPLARVSASTELTALSAIGLALLGGIILNLMPCVFPVLFLKGLALVQSSGQERKRMRAHGLVYTLGILVSFWLIVGVLLALRATGSHIGWGFQLQSPTFIAVLAGFLFLFALSLAGQFDLGLSLTSAGGELAKKEGYAGSFFTGVLATIVATPCTAPLMGAAIGFALAQPPAITFAVFTALGLGLALPYLMLTLQPSWTRLLPRPGAWMETLKQVTAVPLFATVIWLVWVYGRLNTSGGSGGESDHITYLLLCFLVLAIAGWVLGRWPAKWPGSLVAILLIALGFALPLTHPSVVVASDGTGPASAVQTTSEPTLKWEPYSQASLEKARSGGHPVFIDFTAAWCLSCQVNERAVLRAKDVEHQLAQHKFTLLKADWTQYSPAITAELASLNRSGVPTYVIYPADPKAAPDVLPELLTKSAVLDAITADTK